MSEAIARSGGVVRAADVVERLLETGRAVLAEGFTADRDRAAAGA